MFNIEQNKNLFHIFLNLTICYIRWTNLLKMDSIIYEQGGINFDSLLKVLNPVNGKKKLSGTSLCKLYSYEGDEFLGRSYRSDNKTVGTSNGIEQKRRETAVFWMPTQKLFQPSLPMGLDI